jgi:hypothetical protein
LQKYFADVMERHSITEHVRFNTEVLAAAWDDETGEWAVTVRDAGGNSEVLRARAVISAVGQLNQPFVPELPGAESFTGPSFHTARWDHSVDLAGKNVVMIGAGATGFQVAPAIAEDVGQLTIFQRTAQWMFPNPDYHAKVGPGVQWALRHLPFYGRWYRLLLFWPACDGGLPAMRVDPDWPHQATAWCSSIVTRRRLGNSRCTTAWRTQGTASKSRLTCIRSSVRKLPLRLFCICEASWARKVTAFWCTTSPCTVIARTDHAGCRTAQRLNATTHRTANTTTRARDCPRMEDIRLVFRPVPVSINTTE